jgi:hypothetical protein
MPAQPMRSHGQDVAAALMSINGNAAHRPRIDTLAE